MFAAELFYQPYTDLAERLTVPDNEITKFARAFGVRVYAGTGRQNPSTASIGAGTNVGVMAHNVARP